MVYVENFNPNLLSEKKIKNPTKFSAYDNILGNKDISNTITLVHSAAISNGNILEKIIGNSFKNKQDHIFLETGDEVDAYLLSESIFNDNFVFIPKCALKDSQIFNNTKTDVTYGDFIVIHNGYIDDVEMKTGCNLDVGKTANMKYMQQKRVEKLNEVIDYASLDLVARGYICCFFEEDKEQIIKGTKKIFPYYEKFDIINFVISGRDFCNFLNISFQDILKTMTSSQKENSVFHLKNTLSAYKKIYTKKEMMDFIERIYD